MTVLPDKTRLISLDALRGFAVMDVALYQGFRL